MCKARLPHDLALCTYTTPGGAATVLTTSAILLSNLVAVSDLLSDLHGDNAPYAGCNRSKKADERERGMGLLVLVPFFKSVFVSFRLRPFFDSICIHLIRLILPSDTSACVANREEEREEDTD